MLRGGLWTYITMIASGRLRAKFAVKYAGHSTLLRRLADLRPEDQDRILTDDTAPVVEYLDGEQVERVERFTHLKTTMLRRVITGRIRPPPRRTAQGRGQQSGARRHQPSTPSRCACGLRATLDAMGLLVP